jgi:hypothetical protein
MTTLSASLTQPLSADTRPGWHRAKRPGLATLARGRGRRHNLLWWLAAALTAGGAGLIPWLVVLASYLPASTLAWNWSTAWAGLDSLEALGLFSTGVLLIRRDARYCLTAAATAALLLVDAWFDVTTSAPGLGRLLAIAMAEVVELPVSAACATLATTTRLGLPPWVRSLAAGCDQAGVEGVDDGCGPVAQPELGQHVA